MVGITATTGGEKPSARTSCHSWWCRAGQTILARQAVVIGVDAFMVRPCVVAFCVLSIECTCVSQPMAIPIPDAVIHGRSFSLMLVMVQTESKSSK